MMSNSPTTAHCGRVNHCRRLDVLTFYLDRVLKETPQTLEDFSLAFARQYHALVPAHARALDLDLPDEAGPYQDYARALDRLRKRVRRYIDGDLHFPAELEEAWAYALPAPYGERCRHELVWRYGFTGAMSVQADPCPDTEVMGRLLREVGRSTTVLAQALANGRIDPDDVADGTIETDLRELESAVGTIRARVQYVRDAMSAPGGPDAFAERRAMVRAAQGGR